MAFSGFQCDEIFREICSKFNVPALTNHQKDAVRALLEGKDTLVCTKTGSGKSLMFQSAITVARHRSLQRNARAMHMDVQEEEGRGVDDGAVSVSVDLPADNPSVVIVLPLLAIMKEHCEKLNGLGFKATYIGKDASENPSILNGQFEFMFARPEDVVGDQKWRNMLSSKVYRERIASFVVDEAHSVINWGESKDPKTEPFREWFSRTGEARSLCPGTPIIALTATASSSKRKKLMKKLCMMLGNTKEIVDSPDRPNIKLSVQLVKGTHKFSETFGWLLQNLSETTDRHIVFCQRRSETSRFFHFFKDANKPIKRFNMYHSKTVERIQEKIISDMENPDGKIRLLFCTNAAGMGVNFAGVSNVIHYGPPCDLDTLLQQVGRAGRDGSQSHHLLIYHKRQLKMIDEQVASYLKDDDKCRRLKIMEGYGTEVENVDLAKHLCCDVCDVAGGDETLEHHFLSWSNTMVTYESEEDEDVEGVQYRVSTETERKQLTELLMQYRSSLGTGSGSGTGSAVVSNDLIHGFSVHLVHEIVEKCDFLSSAQEVLLKTNIMSSLQASFVADLFELVFPGSVFRGVDEESDDDFDV